MLFALAKAKKKKTKTKKHRLRLAVWSMVALWKGTVLGLNLNGVKLCPSGRSM